jgi:hypothetical protein
LLLHLLSLSFPLFGFWLSGCFTLGHKSLRLRLWHLRLIVFLGLISLALEHIQKCVGTAHEVRVICVDVRVLDLDQLDDHVGCGVEALVQDLLHHITDLILEPLEAVDVVEVNSPDDISELLVNFVGALKGRLEQAGDLLPN